MDPSLPSSDSVLIDRLRAGDEQAFAAVIDTYHASMLRVARAYVSSREAAEDVVQETFLGVINGLSSFEARSSFKTWMFRILVNRARTRGEREGRTRPFSSIVDGDGAPAVDPSRFATDGRWAGFWTAPPTSAEIPDTAVLVTELGQRLWAALDTLPPTQRSVIELRDVLGCTSSEVCELLDITEANQRVLLHRARSKARAALEEYVDDPRSA